MTSSGHLASTQEFGSFSILICYKRPKTSLSHVNTKLCVSQDQLLCIRNYDIMYTRGTNYCTQEGRHQAWEKGVMAGLNETDSLFLTHQFPILIFEKFVFLLARLARS